MVQTFIDEEYLTHFFNSLINSERFTEEDALRNEMWQFFKSKTNINLETDFNSCLNTFDEKTKMLIETCFLNSFTTNRKNTVINVNQTNYFRNLKNIDVYSKLKYPFCSFWLGKEYKFPIDKYSQKNPYYFLSKENDIEKWKLFSKKGNYFIASNVEKNSPDVFTRKTMLNHAHSYKDIIISDHYAFQKKTGIIENLIPYIIGLSSNKTIIENIILFAEAGLTYKSIDETYNLIKDALTNNGINSNIIIYESPILPHGRYFITNNVYIESAGSIDFFYENGDLKSMVKLNDSSIKIEPIFESNKSSIKSILTELKKISQSIDVVSVGTKSKKCILDLFDVKK